MSDSLHQSVRNTCWIVKKKCGNVKTSKECDYQNYQKTTLQNLIYNFHKNHTTLLTLKKKLNVSKK